MKAFGTGSSVFYLRNRVDKPVQVTFTFHTGEEKKGTYFVRLEPSKDHPERLVLESEGHKESIEISTLWKEKCEDLCANTFITLMPSEDVESSYKEILIKL